MQTFGFPSLRDEGISMSADAQLLVSWSQHFIGAGSLHIWRPSLGKRWNLGGTHQWVYKAILSPDGERGAAICGDKQIRIWSLSEPLQSPPVYIQPVATLGYCTEARSPLASVPMGTCWQQWEKITSFMYGTCATIFMCLPWRARSTKRPA